MIGVFTLSTVKIIFFMETVYLIIKVEIMIINKFDLGFTIRMKIRKFSL